MAASPPFCNTTLPGCDPEDCVCDVDCFVNPDARYLYRTPLASVLSIFFLLSTASLVWVALELWGRRKSGINSVVVLLGFNTSALVIRVAQAATALARLSSCDNAANDAIGVLGARLPHVFWICGSIVLVGVWADSVRGTQKLVRKTAVEERRTLQRRLSSAVIVLLFAQAPTLTLIMRGWHVDLMWPISNGVIALYMAALMVGGIWFGWRLTQILETAQKRPGGSQRSLMRNKEVLRRVRRAVVTLTTVAVVLIIAIMFNAAFNRHYWQHLAFFSIVVIVESLGSLAMTSSVSRMDACSCVRRSIGTMSSREAASSTSWTSTDEATDGARGSSVRRVQRGDPSTEGSSSEGLEVQSTTSTVMCSVVPELANAPPL